MILHDFALSSASYRVRMVFALKGLAYEKCNYVLRAGDQRGPDYVAVNPACLVPQMFNAWRFAVDLTPFPRVTAIADRSGSLSAVKCAAPPTM